MGYANQFQLWDVCSDQEAVDLIYNIQDPQEASKTLVDHALSRFSTDNLSVMVVRLDTKAMQEVAKKAPSAAKPDTHAADTNATEPNPASTSRLKPKRLSEAENIVELARKNTPASEDTDAHARSIAEALDQELGPEMSLPDEQQGGVSIASVLGGSKSKPNDYAKADSGGDRDKASPKPK